MGGTGAGAPPAQGPVEARPTSPTEGLRARLRLNVTNLRRIGGLAEAVATLAGVGQATLVSRAAWDLAFARVRESHADDGEGPARLVAKPFPSAGLRGDLARAVHLARHFPGVLTLSLTELDACSAGDLALILTPDGVETAPRTIACAISFLQVHHAARCVDLAYADVRDAGHLSAITLRDRRKGSQRKGKGRATAHPSWRPSARYALVDPGRDALALAHAAGSRTSADVEVAVHGGSKALVGRGARETGVRRMDAFSWDRDPATAAAMAAAARDWCLRHAAWRVVAPEGAAWMQAVVHRVGEGHAAFVLRHDGRVTHHVVGRSRAPLGDHLGAVVESIATVAVDMTVAGVHSDLPSGSCTGRPVQPDGRDVLDVSDGLAPPVAHLPRWRRVTFAERVRTMASRGSRVAVISFEEACPPALRLVARMVTDADSPVPRGAQGLRALQLPQRLRALAVASAHGSVEAVAGAACRVPALAAVARCDKGWRGASRILAEGGRDNDALVRFATDVTGWPANRSIARMLRDRVPPPGGARESIDPIKVAVAMAIAAPSRPAMDSGSARDALDALRVLRVDVEALDPILVAAVVGSLSDGPGPATLTVRATSVADAWDAFGRCAGRCGLAPDHAAALREEAFLPPGRNLAGLARISAAWHSRTVREERERHDLLGRLAEMERRSLLSTHTGSRTPWSFPAPFTAPVTVDGVEVVPLRDDEAFLAESEAQSSCVASYRGDARRGRLVVHSLRSAQGRSTAGHWVHVVDGKVAFRLFQHEADQSVLDSTPPTAHTKAIASVMRSLAGPAKDSRGDGGWQARMVEAIRMHDALGSRVDAGALTGARREELLASDLTVLRRMLGRNHAALDAPGLQAHAQALMATRVAERARIEARAMPRR